jgi:hypothetical protein
MIDSPPNAESDAGAQEAASPSRAEDRVPSPTSVMLSTEDTKLHHNATTSHWEKTSVAPHLRQRSLSPPESPPRQGCMQFDQLRHRIHEERAQRAVLQSAASSELDFMKFTGLYTDVTAASLVTARLRASKVASARLARATQRSDERKALTIASHRLAASISVLNVE